MHSFKTDINFYAANSEIQMNSNNFSRFEEEVFLSLLDEWDVAPGSSQRIFFTGNLGIFVSNLSVLFFLN